MEGYIIAGAVRFMVVGIQAFRRQTLAFEATDAKYFTSRHQGEHANGVERLSTSWTFMTVTALFLAM